MTARPHLSSRVPSDLAPNALTRALDARRAAGKATLDLTASNPTRVGLPDLSSEMLGALADARAQRYEPTPEGLLSAREAVARYYRDAHGVVVSPDAIVLTASSSEAYAWIFKLLCEPGDVVLAPRPSYPLFELLARGEAISLAPYPLYYDGAWHLDVASVRAACTDRARAVVVVHPNNPTGSYLKSDERDALVGLASERGLAIVSDEVFFDYPLRDDARRAGSAAAIDGALSFTLGGLSKLVGLPQMKLGWIVVNGPRDVRDEALARLGLIADTFLSVGTPVQHAAARWIDARAVRLDAIVSRVRDNYEFARAALTRDRSIPCNALDLEGGWYLTLQLPATRSEESWTLAFLDAGVWLHPGFFFEFEREPYAIVSLLTEPATFRAGFDIVLACVRAEGT